MSTVVCNPSYSSVASQPQAWAWHMVVAWQRAVTVLCGVYACMYVCVHEHEHVPAYAYTCEWGPEGGHWMSFPIILLIF